MKIGRVTRPVSEREKADKTGKHALSQYAYISPMRRAAHSGRILMKLGRFIEVDDAIL
jgi:hypothetical protein